MTWPITIAEAARRFGCGERFVFRQNVEAGQRLAAALKSAMDLYKAGVVSLTHLASLGSDRWDYEDRRRVVVQRSGVNRTRPAMKAGWAATFELMVMLPEYISAADLNEVIAQAGRLIGLGDFRPTYGRFQVVRFDLDQE